MTPVKETIIRRLSLVVNCTDMPDSYSLIEIGEGFCLSWKLVFLVSDPKAHENNTPRGFLLLSDGNAVYGFERPTQEAPVEVTNEQETLPS